jgi:hypothetical protein
LSPSRLARQQFVQIGVKKSARLAKAGEMCDIVMVPNHRGQPMLGELIIQGFIGIIIIVVALTIGSYIYL